MDTTIPEPRWLSKFKAPSVSQKELKEQAILKRTHRYKCMSCKAHVSRTQSKHVAQDSGVKGRICRDGCVNILEGKSMSQKQRQQLDGGK